MAHLKRYVTICSLTAIIATTGFAFVRDHLQGPVLSGSEKWSVCLLGFPKGFRATSNYGSSNVSIGAKPPHMHVHSYLNHSELLVAHDWQDHIRAKQESHSSLAHGHNRQLRALRSSAYRGYRPWSLSEPLGHVI